MTKSDAPSQIDAVDVGEVKIDLTSGNINGQPFKAMVVTVKYALVVTKTGERVGAGTSASWSPETQEKVRELLVAMESDISTSVFGAAPTSSSGGQSIDPNPDGVPGL